MMIWYRRRYGAFAGSAFAGTANARKSANASECMVIRYQRQCNAFAVPANAHECTIIGYRRRFDAFAGAANVRECMMISASAAAANARECMMISYWK